MVTHIFLVLALIHIDYAFVHYARVIHPEFLHNMYLMAVDRFMINVEKHRNPFTVIAGNN